MKAAKKTLTLVLIALTVLMMLPQPARAAAVHEVWDSDQLTDALVCTETTTIRLMDNIDYDTGIVIAGKTITFDLNGKKLNVTVATGNGLEVGSGGVVDIVDSSSEKTGEFNITSNAASGIGVCAINGGRATVTNATALGAGVCATGDGSRVAVLGDVQGGSTGASVVGKDSSVEIGGNVTSSRLGVEALSEGDVLVHKNVTVDGDWAVGVSATVQATATVNGDVIVDGEDATGVSVTGGSAVTVEGNVTVSGTYVTGVNATDNFSVVHINGALSVPRYEYYIILNSDEYEIGDGVPDGSYLKYTDDVSYVYVTATPACAIGATEYDTLDEALEAAAGAETTIKLLRSINYNTGIEVVGKTVIFDLNGCSLMVMNSDGNGLTVGAGGVVDITDTSGEEYIDFYVVSSNAYGVYAHDGGQATVTTAGGQQGGVYAAGGASVYVKNIAYGVNSGVTATGGSTVTVDFQIGVMGVGRPYIMLGDAPKIEADGVMGTGAYANYLVYSDTNGNTVRVKTDKVCKIGSDLYESLDDALEDVYDLLPGWSATITLLADIEYDTGIVINDRTLTFDLNGHTLDVTNNTGHGLEVGSGGVVNLSGSGEFNVTSSAGYGVYVHDGGKAEVTNAEGFIGAAALGNDNDVEIAGNVISTQSAIQVTGERNVVIVHGNVSLSGDDRPNTAGVTIMSGSDSTVLIGGNLTVTGTNATGISLMLGGSVIIQGEFSAPEEAYIVLFTLDGGDPVIASLTAGDGVTGTLPEELLELLGLDDEAYRVYTDEINAVYVKIPPVSAAIDPSSAAFDKNPVKQADVTTDITWNDASSVADIKVGGASIGSANYSVSENTLTIRKAYLAAKTIGDLVLTIEFDEGDPAVLTIAISDTTPESAIISPTSGAFDKYSPADVNTAITWNDATSVTDIKAGGASIGEGNYTVSGNTLMIKKEYLASQVVGDLALTIEFDIGNPATLTVAIIDTTPITGLPTTYTMYEGGRVTWNPQPDGGTWDWDEDFFTATFNSPATFTALKAGTSTITYTVNGVSQSITVTIHEAELPVTGQDFTPAIWLLVAGVFTGVCAGGGFIVMRISRRRKERA